MAGVVGPAHVDLGGADTSNLLIGRLGWRDGNGDCDRVGVSRVAGCIKRSDAVIERGAGRKAGGGIGEGGGARGQSFRDQVLREIHVRCAIEVVAGLVRRLGCPVQIDRGGGRRISAEAQRRVGRRGGGGRISPGLYVLGDG